MRYLGVLDRRITILLGSLWATIALGVLLAWFFSVAGSGMMMFPWLVLVLILIKVVFALIVYRLVVPIFILLTRSQELNQKVHYPLLSVLLDVFALSPLVIGAKEYVFGAQKNVLYLIIVFLVFFPFYLALKMYKHRQKDFYWALVAYVIALPTFLLCGFFLTMIGARNQKGLLLGVTTIFALVIFIYYLLFHAPLIQKWRKNFTW